MLTKLKTILKNKLHKNAFRKRSLPMILVHEFETGEKLYTYRVEDLQHIRYKHYQSISEINAYLFAFGYLPNEWKVALKQMKNEANKGLDSNADIKRNSLVQIIKMVDHFEARTTGLIDTTEALENQLLCMFYVLEDENEKTFDEVSNQKKIALFAKNPELRAFFLKSLPKVSEVFKVTSQKDLYETLQMMALTKNIARPSIL